MSYPQFQAASDYLGAIADEDYVKALPSNSYEDRGGAVLDGPEAGTSSCFLCRIAEQTKPATSKMIQFEVQLMHGSDG